MADQPKGNGRLAAVAAGAERLATALSPEQMTVAVRMASRILDRYQFANDAGLQFAGERNVYQRLGYRDQLEFAAYWSQYTRGGIAEAVVEAYPKAAFASGLELVETDDETLTTPLERAVVALDRRMAVWARLRRAAILARVGRYSTILIGASGALDSELPRGRKADGSGLLYLTALGENRAAVEQLGASTSSPRFGRPEFYTLNLGDGAGQFRVHWSRVVHMAFGLLDDDVYGKPCLRAVFNYLDDLLKMVGGGAESYWRRMDPGRHVSFPTTDGSPKLTTTLRDDVVASLDEMDLQLSRNVVTQGPEIKVLEAAIAQFGPAAQLVIDLIAGAARIPKRMLTGSERGELASSQDESSFQGQVLEWWKQDAEPPTRQLFDRLIEYGYLPALRSEEDGYRIVRPDEQELNEGEKSEAVSKLASANAAHVSAGLAPVMTPDEIRARYYDLDPLEDDWAEAHEADAAGEPSADDAEEGAAAGDAGADGDEAAAIDDGGEPRRAAALRLAAGSLADRRRAEATAIRRAAGRSAPRIAGAVLAMWAAAAGKVDARTLEHAVTFGNRQEAETEVVRALTEAEAEALGPVAASYRAAVAAGAEATLRVARRRGSLVPRTAAALLRSAETDPALAIAFDLANPRSVEFAAKASSKLITEISPSTKAAIRKMVAEAFERGASVDELARMIRARVGLRSDQVAALQRFADKGASKKAMERYERKLLRQRSILIGRTEAMRSSNAGTQHLWLQAQDKGLLDPDAKRVWLDSGDDAVRDSHRIGGQVRGLQEPFELAFPEAGKRVEPGEEPNCRCTQSIATAEDIRKDAANASLAPAAPGASLGEHHKSAVHEWQTSPARVDQLRAMGAGDLPRDAEFNTFQEAMTALPRYGDDTFRGMSGVDVGQFTPGSSVEFRGFASLSKDASYAARFSITSFDRAARRIMKVEDRSTSVLLKFVGGIESKVDLEPLVEDIFLAAQKEVVLTGSKWRVVSIRKLDGDIVANEWEKIDVRGVTEVTLEPS